MRKCWRDYIIFLLGLIIGYFLHEGSHYLMVILFGGDAVFKNGSIYALVTVSRLDCVFIALSGPILNLFIAIISLVFKNKPFFYANLSLFLLSCTGNDFRYLYWFITNQPFQPYLV